MTNLGVTRKTWAAWTGRRVQDVTEAEMRALSIEQVMIVYHRNYWLAVRGDELPPGVNLRVFDIHGREITTLVDGYLNAGFHQVTFDAQGLPSGMYFYQLTAGSFRDIKRMLVIK